MIIDDAHLYRLLSDSLAIVFPFLSIELYVHTTRTPELPGGKYLSTGRAVGAAHGY